jgi:Na+/phosphate symporter
MNTMIASSSTVFTFATFASVVGGLGIFLLGMKQISEGLQAVAGPKMRKLVAAATTNRFAGVATGASALFITSKNKATAQEAMDQAKEITKAGAYLNETCAKIQALSEETSQIYYPLSSFHAEMGKFVGADYTMLDNEQKKKLGTLVNNALTLTALVNKKIEADE